MKFKDFFHKLIGLARSNIKCRIKIYFSNLLDWKSQISDNNAKTIKNKNKINLFSNSIRDLTT